MLERRTRGRRGQHRSEPVLGTIDSAPAGLRPHRIRARVDGGCVPGYSLCLMSSESGAQASSTGAQGDAPGRTEPNAATSARASDPFRAPERLNVLVLSLLTFCLIAFGLWLISAGKAYREEYGQSVEGWRIGGTRAVEITLVRNDRRNLSCASDKAVAGLRCAYAGDGHTTQFSSPDDPNILQPYNTVGNELVLGAGLWSSADLTGTLPNARFTTICNYTVKGYLRSASIRFDARGRFSHLGNPVPVGIFTDCVLPQ